MYDLIDSFFSAVKNKEIDALDALFTEDAIYIDRNGATYNGLSQIKAWLAQLVSDGEVRAWDIRRVIDSGAVVWYYEYRFYYAGSVSYDGVSIFEVRDGKLSRWSDYIQSVKKTYPLEGKKRQELLEMAGAVEYGKSDRNFWRWQALSNIMPTGWKHLLYTKPAPEWTMPFRN